MIKSKILLSLTFILLYFTLSVFFIPNRVSGLNNCNRNLYISSTGNDTNNGLSETSAFRTIEKISKINIRGGDCILLEGGKTFEGMLWIDSSKDSASSTAQISVSSYGVGLPTILAKGRPGIFIHNIGNINIQNLNITSSGALNNSLNGITISSEVPNMENITVNNIRVFGFGGFGIDLGVSNKGNYIKNVKITNSSFYQNGRAGLITHGFEVSSIQNVLLDTLFVYENQGIPGATYNTGDGIVLANTYAGKISNSRVYNNGINCSAINCASGIMVYSSSKIIVERNNVFNNRTSSKNDGNGIDLDFDTSDSTVQYNYTYNNDGPGILVYDFTQNVGNTRNIVRYNLSYNDGKKSNMPNIAVGGFVDNLSIYNNTVYASNLTSNSPLQIWDWKGNNAKIENNIFYKLGTSGYTVNIWNSNISNLQFSNNNYYAPNLGFRILWNNSYFDKLTDWQKNTAQDKFAIIADPQLVGGFKLASTSPLYNMGKLITTPITDYFGYAVPNGSAPEIGFSELIK